MKFELTDLRDDGSGEDLWVVAEKPSDVVRMQSVMGIFDLHAPSQAEAYAKNVREGSLRSKFHRKVLPVSIVLPGAFAPYRRELERLTGYEARDWSLDLTNLVGGLQHMYLAERIWTDGPNVCMDGFGPIWSRAQEPVNAQQVSLTAADYLQEKLGRRKIEAEFAPDRTGSYRPNPKYLHRYPAEPALGSAEVWAVVFEHWRKNFASAGQRDALDRSDELSKGYVGYDYALRTAISYNDGGVFGYQLTVKDPNGNIDWDGKGTMVKHIKWEEFKKL